MTLSARIRRNLHERGNALALLWRDEQIRFSDLAASAEHWARFLNELEIAAGERVMFVLPNGPDLVRIHLGNLLCGRISLPVNPRSSRDEMARIIASARPALIVTAQSCEVELRSAMAEASHSCHLLEECFIAAAFSAGERSAEAPQPEEHDDDPAMLVYTSGTTGDPKGVVLSQQNLLAGIEALEQAWKLEASDCLYLSLPLFHIHGLGIGIHGMFVTGHRVRLEERFEAADALRALADESLGITLFYGVPTCYHRLVAEVDESRIPGLRLAVSGSAPLSAELHARVRERFGIEVLERYGMTETLMLTSNPLEGERRPGSVGLPLPGVALQVTKDDGEIVRPGEEGEIRVSGPNVFQRYWQNREATERSFDAEGRFMTGDLGRIDPETGYVEITGRKKELIISGGFNIHPREVEECILRFPGIRECAVTGRPDAELGELVCAHLVHDDALDEEALRKFLKKELSAYKCPRIFRSHASLPRNAMGKLQRHLLDEEPS